MKAINVTDENFEKIILRSGKTALIDFGAEWCPPCRAMSPIIDSIAEDHRDKAVIGKLDVDTNPLYTEKFGVRNLPTFLLFSKGKLVERIVGAVPKNILEQRLHTLYDSENK